MTTTSRHPVATLLRPGCAAFAAALVGLAAALLASCGGGVGTGGTGSFAAASVGGFGSVFVGGIEFEDTRAEVLDDDGASLAAAAPNVLRLGMTVEVRGGDTTEGAFGRAAAASSVRLVRLAVGPVTAIDVAGRSVTVLGQTVQVTGSTVFDPAIKGGLAGLRGGDSVSVHAFASALGRPVATRIEPAAAADTWRLRGFAAEVNAQTRRLQIGAAALDYAAATGIPAGLASGQFVHLRLARSAGAGLLQVESFLAPSQAPGDAARVVVEGVAAAIVPGASLRLGALNVDTRTAVVVPAASALPNGAHIEVAGRLEAGTLVAETITVPTPQATDRRSFQLVGAASAVDVGNFSFVVRGVGVDYRAARFVDGTAAMLALPNAGVRVRGPLSVDGTTVQADVISFR